MMDILDLAHHNLVVTGQREEAERVAKELAEWRRREEVTAQLVRHGHRGCLIDTFA